LFDELSFPYPPTFNDDYKGRELTAGESHATIKDLTKGDLKSEIPQGLSADSLKRWKYQQFIKNYLRCVRSVDDNVGNIVDYLKKNGLDKNTIIVYMGDQGFYLGEHGWYDKRWMYEESLQMACIISDPRISNPSPRVNALAMNIDITPTLLNYARVKIPSDIQGVSLLALLKDEKTAAKTWRKAAYYQYFEYQKGLAHNIQPHYGVRTDRYKLIHFYYDVDVWEFYDLKTDPTELKNQYNNPVYKDKIAQLKLEIKKQQKQYGDDMSLEERRKLTEKYKRKITE
jgi:arylsulfatase A-like enzyme